MKKILLIAAMAVMSFVAQAQEFKFGYVDFNELFMLMPEMDEARATIEENQKVQMEMFEEMYKEYETKMQAYQQNNATWTPAVKEMKEKEIMDIQTRLEQTQQSLQAELQQLQGQLQAPVIEKAQKAVEDLAKAKGVAGVFEKTSLLYINPAQMIDLTPEARVALNIPEGRTLEQLQQELAAKAQAGQQAM